MANTLTPSQLCCELKKINDRLDALEDETFTSLDSEPDDDEEPEDDEELPEEDPEQNQSKKRVFFSKKKSE